MVINQKTQVLLLYPKTGQDFGSTISPPHGLLTVAAPLLEAGYKVKILDQRVKPITEGILKKEFSDSLFCVGISTMVGTQIRFALNLARMVRRITDGKVPIVWGGCQPSVIPNQTIENEYVDYVVIGEGDLTLLDMLKAWEHKQSLENVTGIMFKKGKDIIKTPSRSLLDVENLLPVPWELVDVNNYIHRDMYIFDRERVLDIGQTSRGCPFRCGFCSSASIRQRKWRAMSPAKAIDRIVSSVRRFNLDGFWLRDDEFYIDRVRANATFEGIIKADIDVRFYTSGTRFDVFMQASDKEIATMKRAGAHTLKFGAESGSQRILDLMQKGIKTEHTIQSNLRCKAHRIIPVFALLVGYPTETFEDINETIELMSRLRKDNPEVKFEGIATYTALPGTPDWDLAIKHGLVPPKRFEDWTNWLFDGYDFQGERIPWFKTREKRIWLTNITHMCQMSNGVQNLVNSIKNSMLRNILKILLRPLSAYYRFRLQKKKYQFTPDLKLIHFLRKNIFYKER